MSLNLIHIIETLLLPPSSPILLILLGLLLHNKKAGGWLAGTGLLLLWLCSIPFISNPLTRSLEHIPALSDAQIKSTNAEVIIVLGGGRNRDAPEYRGDTISHFGLTRLRYAAKLHRMTNLPIIPVGGDPAEQGPAEAVMAKKILQEAFKIPIQHIEADSRTTWENAKFSALLLHQLGIKRVLLVTHATHMPRSIYAFQQAGVDVVAAPTRFHPKLRDKNLLLKFLPNAKAANDTTTALHEYLGIIWYRLKGLSG
ncbi:MAG: YdcF family protein [Candidatus Polarisedimenticolaceae bacterium]|nr:YdcF family protein [Candidatus Polarisedimenticolaceae bacterium]